RKAVETPGGFDLELYAQDLTGPVAIAFDPDGNLIIAEGGLDGSEPKIYGFTPDRKRFDVYPTSRPILGIGRGPFRMYGPVGGLVCHDGRVFVSHRDADDFGVITALDYKGGARTVVAGLPARGENGVTGMAVHPLNGRLYFGVGSATNSGIVGPDDMGLGWPRRHPDVHDLPFRQPDPQAPDGGKNILLWGRRMNSPNPGAFGLAPDLAVTAPFQPFGSSSRTRIPSVPADNPKCNSAILSVRPDGGDLRLEAWGIRLPKGLAFTPAGALYFTNQGMELRGSRPVKDDPDSLLLLWNTWYGWPDFSTDLLPITDPKFQPPVELIVPTGYPDLSFLINHQASGLPAPSPDTTRRRDSVYGVMPSQSGASGVAFVPDQGPFSQFRGTAIVAQFGDRTPFSTSGKQTKGPQGFKVVRVDLARQSVEDFVWNVGYGPASRRTGSTAGELGLERPVDVKFGPDGALYILDFGRARVDDGGYRVEGGTGRIFRVIPGRASAG
ncbi:MAG TPA: hypothetical protein VF796_06705, partial [Humisphaera sp.]